uniref:NADH dehydrogenase [ubiquinone] 1 beta subcomplex subunit 11, mitochondrial n=1 Tax=Bracon brevicornis TaxID=1563983 RepID=A0A6V7J1T2_9HYME
MAGLLRFTAVRSLRRDLSALCRQRNLNTSSRPPQASQTPIKTAQDFENQNQNWLSWGWSDEDKLLDRFLAHATFFVCVSLVFCVGAFVTAYRPDPKLREWAQREAYLQLRYREEHGLPPIDRNYVDPSKIILPTDEELGDTEIII